MPSGQGSLVTGFAVDLRHNGRVQVLTPLWFGIHDATAVANPREMDSAVRPIPSSRIVFDLRDPIAISNRWPDSLRNSLRLLALACGLAILSVVPLTPGFASPSAEAPSEQVTHQNWYMVTDRASILDENQERSAINDAYRLFLHGIPTKVLTEYAALSQAQADARARELRISLAIESSRGANDGLLLYAAVDPRNRDSIVMSISEGGTTLPRNGLDDESLQAVRDTVLSSQLSAGRPARAIVYSLREIIYLEQYVPAAVTEVTGWKAAMQQALVVIGPGVALGGSLWLTWRRSLGLPARPMLVSLMAAALAALGLALSSFPSQSSIGVFSALALGLVTLWHAIVADTAKPDPGIRMVATQPRGPQAPLARPRQSRTQPQ